MRLESLLTFLFTAGVAVAIPDSLEDDGPHRARASLERKSYKSQFEKSINSYGECVIVEGMIVRNESVNNICMEGTQLQAILPSLYAQINSPSMSECMETALRRLEEIPQWNKVEEALNKIKEYPVNEQIFCMFIDEFIAPLACYLQDQCPGKTDRQALEAFITIYYSTQQFLHGGMETEFSCQEQNITINPQLYKLSTKFDPQISFLTTPIDCRKFEPATAKSTTRATSTTSTTTTARPTSTTKDPWAFLSSESALVDSDEWLNFGDEDEYNDDWAYEQEEEVTSTTTTTTQAPKPKSRKARMRSERHSRRAWE